MCEKCKDGGNILDGYFENSKGKSFTRLRFDLDSNQFDMQYGICGEDNVPIAHDWTHSIDIAFCPFCGKRLPVTMTASEFIDLIKPTYIEIGSNIDKILSFMLENKDSSHLMTFDNFIMSILTNKYGTEVESIGKVGDLVNIFFKEPRHKHIKGL